MEMIRKYVEKSLKKNLLNSKRNYAIIGAR